MKSSSALLFDKLPFPQNSQSPVICTAIFQPQKIHLHHLAALPSSCTLCPTTITLSNYHQQPRRRRRRKAISSEAKSNRLPVTVAVADDKPVRIVALVGQGSVSPLKNAPWEEVLLHT
ncbi:hypothetical protein Ancab_002975, partial [Ancistrocladus abbreviatus]